MYVLALFARLIGAPSKNTILYHTPLIIDTMHNDYFFPVDCRRNARPYPDCRVALARTSLNVNSKWKRLNYPGT
jgi:hypothetical protein